MLKELTDFTQSSLRDNVSDMSGLSKTTFPDKLRGSQLIYCFMIDDVCYSVLKSGALSCAQHGEQRAEALAPDLAFCDIEDSLLIRDG
jgi:hypothetical protein